MATIPDPTDFERVALPCLKDCYAFAVSLCRNAADAEDLVQDTFLRAQRSFDSFAPGTNIKAWLFTILRRLHIDGHRRTRHRPSYLPEEEIEGMAVHPDTPDVSEALLGKVTAAEVVKALGEVPEPFRLAVRLRDLDGLTYDEIGRVLAVPPGTVMSRIHRGRECLRRLLVPPRVLPPGPFGRLCEPSRDPRGAQIMTGSPARPDAPAPRPCWTGDPIERARYLDGECSPAEKAARDADLARDPAARDRVRREGEFLAALRRGKAVDAAAAEPSELLEVRVRRALAADRAAGFPSEGGALVSMSSRRAVSRRSLVLAGLAVAAAVALWVGGRDVQPTDAAAVYAAKTLRDALHGNAPKSEAIGTCEQGQASPYKFPLVANRELRLVACAQADSPDRSASVVQTGNEAEDAKNPRGLVSVAGAGSGNAPVIGVTKFEDIIVFDVSIGGAKYYLASSRAFVERKGGDCAACHGTSREGKASPHTFQLRNR